MDDTIKIQFVIWGGESSLSKRPELLDDDWNFMKYWSSFYTGNSRFENYLSENKITWLDLPIETSNKRLFLKPYFEKKNGSRGLYYFLGCFLTLEQYKLFSSYNEFLSFANELDLHFLLNNTTDYVSFEKSKSPNYISEMDADIYEQTFRGNYHELCQKHIIKINMVNSANFKKYALACNPPFENNLFTTLFITDDFCYPGYKIIKKKEHKKANLNIDSDCQNISSVKDVNTQDTISFNKKNVLNHKMPLRERISTILNILINGKILDESQRDERECPWCAEKILVAAKVCKHCNRDVKI